MMLWTLAWRNVWRNRRRSVIVLTSIVIGMVMMDYTGNFARGLMQQALANQLGLETAHVQVHARGFRDNKVVQNFMATDSVARTVLAAHPLAAHVSRRVVAFGLLSSASSSSGVSLVGVEPEREPSVSIIKSLVRDGHYLADGSRDVVIGRRLAKTLDVALGDRVVLMATALDGSIGSELFRVAGLFESPNLTFDRMTVFVPLPAAQRMLRVGERTAEIAVIAASVDSVTALQRDLQRELGDRYEVLSYQDLLPTLLGQIASMETMMAIFSSLIALAMVFGIVNTLLMSVFERIRELGVLKSIGMSNGRVFRMIMTEALLLGLCGTAIGGALGFTLGTVLERTGINLSAFAEGLASYGSGAVIYPVPVVTSLLTEAAIIVAFCLFAAIYPAIRAVRLEPIDAIRQL